VARKTEIINVTSDGRDKGKQFIITEMPALRAERWAFRALLALAHSGVQLPEGAADGGMAVLASAGLQALNSLDFEEARPLLDEMWSCVQIVPDPKNPNIIRPLVIREADGDDIEELTTIFQLRERIFRLHTDFFFKGK
jgi:hypothetical protein